MTMKRQFYFATPTQTFKSQQTVNQEQWHTHIHVLQTSNLFKPFAACQSQYGKRK